VTPPDSAECEPTSTQRTVSFERFDGVSGATGIITARRGQQGAERYLISAHEQNEECSHQVSLDPESAADSRETGAPVSVDPQFASRARMRSISAASAEKAARYASGRIRMTMSAATSAGRRRVRESSRRRRFTRFRATAECRNRGTINPTRVLVPAGSTRGEAMTRTSSNTVRIRFPSCAMRCSSAPRVMRARRGNPSDARGVSGSGVLVRDSDRQLLPSLLPTTGKGLPTPLRFHTRTASVRLQAPRVARAVGRLSHGCSKYGLN
jgi:hypothetical protein